MDRKGFSPLAILLVAVIFLVAGWVWFYEGHAVMPPSIQNNKSTSTTTQAMAGNWSWKATGDIYNNGGGKSLYTDEFDLALRLGDNNTVSGSYSAAYNDGGYLDDAEFTGVASGTVANVVFFTSYSDSSGTAELDYNPASDTLHWIIKTAPSDTYYAPSDAVLKRS